MPAASTGSASSLRSRWFLDGIDVVPGFAAFGPMRQKFGGEFRPNIGAMHTSWCTQRSNPTLATHG